LDCGACDLGVSLLKKIEVPDANSPMIHKSNHTTHIKSYLLCVCKKVQIWYELQTTDLFSISTKSVTGPLLPRVTLAICWAALAILKARFKQSRTLLIEIALVVMLPSRISGNLGKLRITTPSREYLASREIHTKKKLQTNRRMKTNETSQPGN